MGDLDDLCGTAVAVEEGTVQVDLLERSQRACDRPIQVRAVESKSTALLQLRTGRVVAALVDYPPAVHLTTSEDTGPDYQPARTAGRSPTGPLRGRPSPAGETGGAQDPRGRRPR